MHLCILYNNNSGPEPCKSRTSLFLFVVGRMVALSRGFGHTHTHGAGVVQHYFSHELEGRGLLPPGPRQPRLRPGQRFLQNLGLQKRLLFLINRLVEGRGSDVFLSAVSPRNHAQYALRRAVSARQEREARAASRSAASRGCRRLRKQGRQVLDSPCRLSHQPGLCDGSGSRLGCKQQRE